MELNFEIKHIAGFGLQFTMDTFRLVFFCITTFMWLTSVVFSREYMKHHENKFRYYMFTALTWIATVGVFLSANLMTTFIFFELMSFTSYVWVAQEETKDALRAASTYLAVAILGGMVMLMGLFLLYDQTGTLVMSELKEACAAAEKPNRILAAGLCMLVGFGAKAGMFPFHIWLPKAHPVAPAPASALLSGVLTKTGIFGIIIISGSILPGNQFLGFLVLILGTITMVWGAVLGVLSVDLKRTFACSSVSQIGFILTGLGMMNLIHEQQVAACGAFLHMVNHSLIKLILFTLAGVVYNHVHALDFNSIRGFGRKKPFFMAAYLVAAFSIAGVPLFSGYVSKTLLHEAIAAGTECFTGNAVLLLKGIEWAFLISGGMTAAYMLKVFFVLFVDSEETEKEESSLAQHTGSYMSMAVKALLCIPMVCLLIFGVLPDKLFLPLAERTERFFFGEAQKVQALTVSFFSPECLKGAAISLVIGVTLYVLFVRTCLRRREEESRITYINIIPAWFDLENSLYRPVFVSFLSFLCATVSRVADKFTEAVIKLVSKTILSEKREKEKPILGIRLSVSYYVGRLFDYVSAIWHKVRHTKPKKECSYTRTVMEASEEMSRASRLITRSVSYGLMLSCIGLFLTLIYMLL